MKTQNSPQNNASPNRQGYPPQGAPVNQQAYPPQRPPQGAPVNQQAYPPQRPPQGASVNQQAYPPQRPPQGAPVNQQAYPPQRPPQGPPVNQQAYPPQRPPQGAPVNQQAYPPQRPPQGAPVNQQAYPPQRPPQGAPVNQQAYPPQRPPQGPPVNQQAYPPQGTALPPNYRPMMPGQQGQYLGQRQITKQERSSLIIIDSTKQVFMKPLENEEITIGRSGDIVLSTSIASRTHGVFKRMDHTYTYQDLGSKNGTYYNGKMLPANGEPLKLNDGDVLRIDSQDLEQSHQDAIIMVYSTKTPKNSNWQTINLFTHAGELLIGRSVPDSHLKIPEIQVSRVHARIIRNQDKFLLIDERSFNGIIVNGERIVNSRLLKDRDVIVIGSTKVIFYQGILIYNRAPNGIEVKVNNLSKVVEGGKVILDNVSLTINSSELVAVIGGSGAGKSTFINCINGFEPATSGQVLFNDTDLYENYNTLKSRIGYVPQKDELHEYLTVFRALQYTARLRLDSSVTKTEITKRIEEVLKIMGLYEHQKSLIKKLSGGQKKRVSIAMELVSNPDIFFLDEPTSGLDPETETQLMKQLKSLSAKIGKTIIVITHTLQNIHLFDQIVFLAPGGKLCYYGTPQQSLEYFDVDSLPEAYEKIKLSTDFYVQKQLQRGTI